MICIIRKMEDQDYKPIANLIRNELGYGDSSDEEVEARLAMMKNREDYLTLIAMYANKIAGFIGLIRGIAYEFSGYYIRIVALAVKKEYQGKGIGSKLLEEAESYAKKMGAVMIAVNSGLQRSGTHVFYANRGYIKKGYSFKKSI